MLRWFTLVSLAACCGLAAGQPSSGSERPVGDKEGVRFARHLSSLTASAHRVSGSPENAAAREYLRRELSKVDGARLYELDLPVMELRTKECRIAVGGGRFRLFPMSPNLIVPPSTGDSALTRSYYYIPDADALDTVHVSPARAVVGVNYDCDVDFWRRLFQLGAAAVVFLGDTAAELQYPRAIKHAGAPVNLLRFYATPAVVDSGKLRRDHDSIEIVSRLQWRNTSGSNLLLHLPGTDPGFVEDRAADEMIVLSAYYDTYGEVPRRCAGTEEAANVAALLESIRYFRRHRPKRDLLFVFSDYHHQNLSGMRAVYDALTMRRRQVERITEDHEAEWAFLNRIAGVVSGETVDREAIEADPALMEVLREVTERRWNDYSEDLMALRMQTPGRKPVGEHAEEIARAKREKNVWGEMLRELTKRRLERIDDEGLGMIARRVVSRVERRREELALLRRIDGQRGAVRRMLGEKRIVLHIGYDFAGEGRVWGPVIGDDLYSTLLPGGRRRGRWDNAGWYGPVMQAIAEAAERLDPGEVTGLNRESLIDAAITQHFIPDEFIAENCVAGVFGYYNCAFMTHHVDRAFRGHPGERTGPEEAERIRRQATEADRLVGALADMEALSLPRSFKSISVTEDIKYPLWNGGAYKGYSAGIRVAGSLTKDRPAAGAICAMWIRSWDYVGSRIAVPGFRRYVLTRVNTYGKYGISGVNKEMYPIERESDMWALAMLFDDAGRVRACSDSKSLGGDVRRIDLFPADGHFVPMPLYGRGTSAQTMVMKAAGNVEPDIDRNLHDIANDYVFFYTHDFFSADRYKVFQKYGAVALHVTEDQEVGGGFDKEYFVEALTVDSITSADLWKLNENRLELFRDKGVTNVDIERLHHRADVYRREAQDTRGVTGRQRLHAAGAMFSRLVYDPIREIMGDMVAAIVVLLILTVPFAFALERLIICATSIYWRVGGFVLMFLISFGLVFLFHPGVSIASSPMIVFLAFAILVLASIVIWIMFSKFKHELMALQHRSTRAHSGEISRMGTAMAAVGMGMSTMRRRPVRTVLTCITVVVLTFTILCFAGFSRSVGVKSAYEGPGSGTVAAAAYLRELDFSELPREAAELLKGLAGTGGLIAPHWWKARTEKAPEPFGVARVDGARNTFVSAVMGITPEEVDRWEELKGALRSAPGTDARTALRHGGVFLPTLMRRRLDLTYGDSVYLDGKKCPFAGEVNVDRMQRLRGLDGRSVLPVDFRSPTYDTTKAKGLESSANAGDLVQRDFVRLSANEIAVTSAENVHKLRGNMHGISVYRGEVMQFRDNAELMARLTALPVWTRGEEGVERLVFARITGVSGGIALVIPILLGGFIIFGTLLGSVTDREREVYTFSALGLSPSHVGFLFLAESGIYAIIGGVGGQILAQFVGFVASILADRGLIHEVTINFSSSNSMFAIVVVMVTVLVSALYPAWKASMSANPGVHRSWAMPAPEGDYFRMKFPFTVSEYDFTGMVSFLAEHFRQHGESGMGRFAAEDVHVGRRGEEGHLSLSAYLYLAPFDLGISHRFLMTAVPSEIPGVSEVLIEAWRKSGSHGDWQRSNKVFLREIRKQFILWRTLSSEGIENYRMTTLQLLEEDKGNGSVS